MKFLQYFYGMSEESAVAEHLGCTVTELDDMPERIRPTRKMAPPKQEEKKIDLTPPAANGNMRRVFAYLCQTRGIDPEVVSAFAHAHLLYESADKHNAVFVGKDEHGRVRHIHMRGTLTGYMCSRRPLICCHISACTRTVGRRIPTLLYAVWAVRPSSGSWKKCLS